MVEYSKQIQDLLSRGWRISDDGFSLIKEERRSISETRPVRVSKFGNRLITIYNEEGKSPRTVRGRRKLKGHIEGYPNSIFSFDSKGNPITILKGKVVALRAIFGEILDEATHIYIQGQLIPIVRVEDRVEVTNLEGISEGEMVNVEVYFYKMLAEEKPLYLEFIYVYTWVSTNKKNPIRRMLEVHWETTIKSSEWEPFKEKTGIPEYGRVSDIVEDWVGKHDYEFIYQYDNEAEEVLGTPIEAVTEIIIRLKPKNFKSDAHIYDLDKEATIRKNIKTLPDEYWAMENSDVATYMLTGGE